MLSTPEYVEKNANVFLTLRNDVSNHVKTISDSILKTIQDNCHSIMILRRKCYTIFLSNFNRLKLAAYVG